MAFIRWRSVFRLLENSGICLNGDNSLYQLTTAMLHALLDTFQLLACYHILLALDSLALTVCSNHMQILYL